MLLFSFLYYRYRTTSVPSFSIMGVRCIFLRKKCLYASQDNNTVYDTDNQSNCSDLSQDSVRSKRMSANFDHKRTNWLK